MLSKSIVAVWLSLILLAVLSLIGWVLNIIDLLGMEVILSGEGALRIAGIFLPPLGAIMGWFV